MADQEPMDVDPPGGNYQWKGDERQLLAEHVGNITRKWSLWLKVGSFAIQPNVHPTGVTIRGGQNYTVYNLTCKDNTKDGSAQNVTVTITRIDVALVNQVPATYTEAPPKVSMMLLAKKPAVANDFVQTVTNAKLGQAIFLAITHETNAGQKTLIPKTCFATSIAKEMLMLWDLHSGKPCYIEKSVMGGRFTAGNTSSENFIVAEFEAFTFDTSSGGIIVITCSVRACASVYSGSCKTDNDALDKCNNPTATAAPTSGIGKRRRRDVIEQDDSPEEGQGRLHHVTTTLRILDDVMTAGGSSRFLYTVTCLTLSVLGLLVI